MATVLFPVVAEKQPFERIEVSRQQALDMFSNNRFKIEIIKDLPEDKTITVYRCGPLIDLCRGPHIPNTSFVKALACTKVRCCISSRRKSLRMCVDLVFLLSDQSNDFRLHQHIVGETRTVKACKEFMEYLIQIRNS
ncbi:hypothetical protein RND71_042593 [Anisodus tanguticus]|uniref:Threonyl/alanyl tRNA synthetase SAD domain-containing protein n=1 Tax=Anisodus tanguticus TaxID=243964 RepID=A0AAE1QR45_9SOLA|nr:hypothetical protein RND71_042593 [Anisodus tanguticus]